MCQVLKKHIFLGLNFLKTVKKALGEKMSLSIEMG